jgi:hypothetical protein
MGHAWWGLATGGGLIAMGTGVLLGRQRKSFGRPRLGGWACVVGGFGIASAALLAITGVLDRIGPFGSVPFFFVVLGLMLFVCSVPLRMGRASRMLRGPRHRR